MAQAPRPARDEAGARVPRPGVAEPGVAEPGGAEGCAYPADLERVVATRSGVLVTVRPIRPADAGRLGEFHRRLSAHSVYLRFFTVHPVLSRREIERFTTVDYRDRLAVVAERDGCLLGVGRYDRIGTTSAAEVAFIVDDQHQRQGIGTLLADTLVGAARARGITELVADTLPENSGMLELFRGLGFPVRSVYQEGVVRVRFPILPIESYERALERREAGRRPTTGRPDDAATGAAGSPRRPC